ncbi:MAG: hypothetical protein IT229_04715 [Flavobacteriales bacterium]|nr:hypothetical protein [Flavobacteriales bacterium]
MEQRIFSLFRALTLVCALSFISKSQAQGSTEHILRFKVDGITTTMQEKRCLESLMVFDPAMVVSIDRQYNVVKVKTLQELTPAQLISAMDQVGIVATLDMKKAEHTDNDQQ